MTSSSKDTLSRMNSHGAQGIPFVFIFDFKKENLLLFEIDELNREGIFLQTSGFMSLPEKSQKKDFYFEKEPVGIQHFEKGYSIVSKAIQRGDTFLLNLTYPTKIKTNLSLKAIFDHSIAKYKLLFKDKFVVFSPEPFITIVGNVISSYPMKGTIDAGLENAEGQLLNNMKEASEHNTIVDLIRNDLSMVAKKVRVEKFRYVECIKTHEKELLQTSSKISGELQDDWQGRIGNIIYALLPAGSISGAPKKKTLEIIEEAEGYDRGFFTGVFGYFDGKNLDSAVMIRFIENQDGQLVFKSGGGVTSFSRCEQEYVELLDKVYVPVLG
jgi:para-aminobenzoate synthetase component 1